MLFTFVTMFIKLVQLLQYLSKLSYMNWLSLDGLLYDFMKNNRHRLNGYKIRLDSWSYECTNHFQIWIRSGKCSIPVVGNKVIGKGKTAFYLGWKAAKAIFIHSAIAWTSFPPNFTSDKQWQQHKWKQT